MNSQWWFEKGALLALTLLSGKGLWEVMKSFIYRNREKAKTDSIIAETYSQALLDVRNELNEVKKENKEQAKEMSDMVLNHTREMGELKLNHQKEIADLISNHKKESEHERHDCHEQISKLTIRITLLEKRILDLVTGDGKTEGHE